MAIQYDGYFSNAIVGQPMVGADIDINEVNSTPKFAIGFGFTRADGNKYRYVQVASATSAGYVLASDMIAGNISSANSVTAPASAVKVSGDNITPGSAGSRYLELAQWAALSANQLAGAYMVVYDGAGAGYTYRVRGNDLTGTIGTGLTRVELYEPLITAVGATSDIIFGFNPYANLINADTTSGTANVIAGVLCADTTASNQFAWVCEEGIIGAHTAAALTIGTGICIGATAGSVDNYTIATAGTGTVGANPIFGKCIVNGGAEKLSLVRINVVGR